MKLHIASGPPLRGTVTLPGDKSISHRAAIFSLLAAGESRIENFLQAGVTQVLLDALPQLGAQWEYQDSSLIIRSPGLTNLKAPTTTLDCGNSATTMRLLAGALAAAGGAAVLDGSPGLRRRPMNRVLQPLQAMGVPISASPQGTAPVRLDARPKNSYLKGIEYTLPVASAQVKTALLLAALAADSPTVIHEPGPSRDHTERLLTHLGAAITMENEPAPTVRLTSQPSHSLPPLHLHIPGDFSSAAFLIVAALLVPGSEITIKHVGLNSTRTGLLDALIEMGADIQISNRTNQQGEPAGDLTVSHTPLLGITIDGPLVVRMIDEFPVFAVAASLATGQTVVKNAAELRHKETDRIRAICQQLSERGVNIKETEDGFTITGGNRFTGGTTKPTGDHRLAMSLTIAGLVSKDHLVVDGAEIIAESFPQFPETLRNLGANVGHG